MKFIYKKIQETTPTHLEQRYQKPNTHSNDRLQHKQPKVPKSPYQVKNSDMHKRIF